MNKVCGIYIIKNKIDGKAYIGKAIDIEIRWKRHISLLNNGKHYNKHLQQAWIINTNLNFEFTILEECVKEQLNEKECYWIALLKVNNNKYGYNMTAGGDGGAQLITKEHKEKISKSLKGRIPWNKDIKNPYSEETIKKIVLANTGKKRSEETCNNISVSLKGKKKSEEAKRNMSNAKKGSTHASPSPETIEKIRQSNLGKKRSNETKKNISIAQKNKKLSNETKLKISLSMKGKNTFKRSDDTKELNSKNMVKRWQNQEYRKKYSENRRKLNNEQLNNLLNDIIENNLLQKEIASKYDISPATVTRYKKQIESTK